jgi:hypothetical protein
MEKVRPLFGLEEALSQQIFRQPGRFRCSVVSVSKSIMMEREDLQLRGVG